MDFIKAHATGNDFVLVTDVDGTLDLPPETVARLCDRHMGIGADGLIRAVAAHASADGATALEEAGLSSTAEAPLWFMDYRNGDGSVAEMCGNGVRAFVTYLLHHRLAALQEGGTLPILTRGGVKTVHAVEEGFAVGMGIWSFIDPELATERASDSLVTAAGLKDPRPALSISMGNPHTVVALPSERALQNLDLHQTPTVEPNPAEGTNVEFVVPADPLVDDDGIGHVSMRVYERGVGETLSCGTGACAAAAAVRVWAADEGVDTWKVTVPGGVVTVRFVPRADGAEDVELAGPATLVYTGQISPEADDAPLSAPESRTAAAL